MQMAHEEAHPNDLVGRYVVESGVRQVWPFLGILEFSTSREVRLYIDTDVTISNAESSFTLRQVDPDLLRELGACVLDYVVSVEDRVEDGLTLVLDSGTRVTISGRENDETSRVPWWVGAIAE